MTVGIGLLCDGGKHILLAADTRASYGPVSQHDQTGKLFDLPDNFFGSIAGSIGWCSEIISELHHRMGNIAKAEMGVEKIREVIQESYGRIFLLIAKEELWNGFKITMDQYLHDEKLVSAIRRDAETVLKGIEVDVELIVAGFLGNAPILLIATGGTSVTIRAEMSPGNAIIGSGSMAALNWLNYRKQNVHCGLAHSLMHLTEAKQFAQVEQSVGPLRQMVLLWSGGWKALEGGQEMLQSWWARYGLPLSDGLEQENYNKDVRDVFKLPS